MSTANTSSQGSATTRSMSSTLETGEGSGDSVSFYERWNMEISSLRERLDRQLQKMVEASQHEMDQLAATVAGITATKSNIPPDYKLSCVGPKIPSPSNDATKQRQRHVMMMKELHKDLPHVLSGTMSERTGKSDRTVPKSNLTRHVTARRRIPSSPQQQPCELRSCQEEDEEDDKEEEREEHAGDEADAITKIRQETNREDSILQSSRRHRRNFSPGSYDGTDDSKNNDDDSDSDIYVEDEEQNQAVMPSPVGEATSPKSRNLFKRLFDPVLERRRGRHESYAISSVPNKGNAIIKPRDAPTTLKVTPESNLYYKPDAPGSKQKFPESSSQRSAVGAGDESKAASSSSSGESSSVREKYRLRKHF